MFWTILFLSVALIVCFFSWVACAVNAEFREEIIKEFYEERGKLPNEKELNAFYKERYLLKITN